MAIRPSENLQEITLLYVEDDENIREALGFILKRYVKTLYTAADGKEGLALFEARRPDIVISDIRMPVMDGLEMVRHMKVIAPETMVVFTTAFGEAEYLKEAIELGVDGYLIKPIDRRKLLERLNRLADAIVNERRKQTYHRLLVALFDAQREAIVLIDGGLNVMLANLAYKQLCLKLGCDDTRFESFAARLLPDEGCLSIDRKENFNQTWLRSFADGVACLEIDGRRHYYQTHLKEIDGLFLVEFQDISHFKEESRKLERENVIDALTGIYNRKIEPRVVEEMTRRRERFCCLMCDLDHFKRINDTYGHGTGDKVLRRVADLMKESLRKEDYLVRWGGEEFLIVMRGERGGAVRVAEKLRRAVEALRFEPVGRVTMSIGVACGTIERRNDFDRVLERADEALYLAKAHGRNRVEEAAADG